MAVKVLVEVFLRPDGAERLAKHGIESVWHWYVGARAVEATLDNGEKLYFQPLSDGGSVKLGEVTVMLPSTTFCAATAASAIEDLIKEARADAEKKITELSARRHALLSITFDPTTGADK